jgi:hypothetical protein
VEARAAAAVVAVRVVAEVEVTEEEAESVERQSGCQVGSSEVEVAMEMEGGTDWEEDGMAVGAAMEEVGVAAAWMARPAATETMVAATEAEAMASASVVVEAAA